MGKKNKGRSKDFFKHQQCLDYHFHWARHGAIIIDLAQVLLCFLMAIRISDPGFGKSFEG
jgi:hypothetical protein